jgi:hypothetical protein
MRLLVRTWFWLLAVPLLALGGFSVSFGLFALLDRVLGDTSLNIWGDMEGLIIPVWTGASILFVVGMVVLIRYLLHALRASRSA